MISNAWDFVFLPSKGNDCSELFMLPLLTVTVSSPDTFTGLRSFATLHLGTWATSLRRILFSHPPSRFIAPSIPLASTLR